MWASGIGLLSTTVACSLFIPNWGVHAAVVGASLAFALQLVYFLFHYRKKS
jgi:O-antigen/teichoic acid export membrane protein